MTTASATTLGVELRHLRTFVATAEELSFTRAAERLQLAQQAVSGQIRQLEDRLGIRLFDRSTRHVALTDAGERLLQSPPARRSIAPTAPSPPPSPLPMTKPSGSRWPARAPWT